MESSVAQEIQCWYNNHSATKNNPNLLHYLHSALKAYLLGELGYKTRTMSLSEFEKAFNTIDLKFLAKALEKIVRLRDNPVPLAPALAEAAINLFNQKNQQAVAAWQT